MDRDQIQAAIEGGIPPLLAGLYRLAGLDSGRCLMAVAPGHPADVRVTPANALPLFVLLILLFSDHRYHPERTLAWAFHRNV